MKQARYTLLAREEMVWTRHEHNGSDVCPVEPDEVVKASGGDQGAGPCPASAVSWAGVTHYETCEPRFPMLAKELEAKAAGSQVIGNFLDWLEGQGINLAVADETAGPNALRFYVPCMQSHTDLIAGFFDIDQKQADRERQQLLDEFVARQQLQQ
ncbi:MULTISPECIES: hypothetical protein [Ectopseudomonas]|uniref:Uncharacterized protein n=2 Tax=Ectopseudomonas TaxID=3236654 RepID=A0A1G6PTL6_9GAMM|nr:MULTISPECIES: hypothetical protein [Pseudomonas]ALN21936.1 hypothetical protein DW68_024985 [Pseudomonas mendocina S5.2]KER98011.1 hypothetical protein HN51_24710 [Pseudomonas mendocina]MBP3061907.1 hypothetical protein [Pseudomonas chengduensis]NNB75199.1 hypothetical protein [Pseudomonas chengduensis]OEO24561.1 hypothetical protein AX279_18015 [Pseudomonas sp. J237]